MGNSGGSSCDIEHLVAPYVDGGMEAGERDRMSRHLEDCPPCREAATEEAAAWNLLRSRAEALHPKAPLDLRSRCMVAAQKHSLRKWRLAWVPLAAAASLVLVAYATRGTTRLLAAQLALDHVKCFTFLEDTGQAVDPSALSRALAAYGLEVRVAAGATEQGLRLVGVRRCFTADGRVAHILYRHDGHDLSLYVLPGHEWKPDTVSMAGLRTITWSAGGNGYAVVARESEEQLRRAVAYLQEEMR